MDPCPNLHPNVHAPKPAAASWSIPVADGEYVQQFKTLWDRKRKFFTVGNQRLMHGWMQCIEISACLYYVPHTVSIYACQHTQKPLATNSKQVICHELCTIWAHKCFGLC